jgi:hypothetical protein
MNSKEVTNWMYSDVHFDVMPLVNLALDTNDIEWFEHLYNKYNLKYRLNKEVG